MGGLRTALLGAQAEPTRAERPAAWSLADLSPPDGTTTREVAIDVAGRLEPPGRGEVRIAGITRPIGEDGRFSLPRLGLEEGENRVEVVARPARPAGADEDEDEDPPPLEATLRVVVDRAAPRVTIAAPVEGWETFDDGVDLRVDVEDATRVQVLVGGVALTAPAGAWSGRGAFTGRVPLPAHGPRSLDVLARDGAGNEARVTRRVVRVAPSLDVTLAEPADGAWLSAETVRVAGRVRTRVPLDQVEVRLAGVATPLGPDGTFQAALRLAEGAHDLEARATARTAGGLVEGRAARQVAVDLTPPALRVLAPRDGSTTSEETITLEVEVTDQSPWVDVRLAGPVQVTRRVRRGERLREAVRLPEGTSVLSLTAADAAKNAAVPVRVRVTREAAASGGWPGGPGSLPSGVRRGERASEYVNEKDGTVLVWVAPGSFRMGSDSGASWEKPVHEVRFAQGFFLGKYETTWGQYRAFCRATGRAEPSPPSFQTDDRHPVVNVSWDDAVAYCRWAGLRLPSEAEWEYAARGSDGRTYPWGDQEPDASRCNLHDQRCPERYDWAKANYSDGHGYTAPVGSYREGASPSGALDLAGNVWEWVQDTYQDSYNGAPANGRAWEVAGSSRRVYRGGCWDNEAWDRRAALRLWDVPGLRNWNLGFRPAR